jgi:diguanylate cyclase (GGDEF)-like protein/PAS domain S-box-containing protein
MPHRPEVQSHKQASLEGHFSDDLRLARTILDTSHEAIVITDADGRIVQVNRVFATASGYTSEEVVGQTPRIMKSGRHNADFYKAMWKDLTENGRWEGEIWDRRKSGEIHPKWLSISAVVDSKGRTTHYVGMFADIASIDTQDKEATQLAPYDPLTGLANRILFQDRLQQALVVADRQGGMVALMLLDLDRFKTVNDTLGHSAGDQLLVTVGTRLTECVRTSDTVARVGGDEFAVILAEVSDPQGPAKVSRRIIEKFREPFTLGRREVFVTTSLGVSVYPEDGSMPEMLFQAADTALYYAKEQGRNHFQFYSDEMRTQYLERMEMERALRADWEEQRFRMHYQPVVELAGGTVVALQALIRWEHRSRGLMMPEEFMPLAEEAGLAVPMGEWVLKTICSDQKKWQDMGLPVVPISVKLSVPQLKKHDFLDRLDAILLENCMVQNHLQLELTESAALQDSHATVELFTELRKRGISVVIDSFGRGYSSLGYLKHLPFDKLKLDQSFVRNVVSSTYDEAIVQAVIGVTHSVNVKVIADGVETMEQFTMLLANHCDEGQGNFFNHPIAAHDVVRFLRNPANPLR